MTDTMIAAIYARKSTEQNGVADEQKSVARQVDHAQAYARRRGWMVDDGCIFVDDGISGAEFSARPGFLRLMNALKPSPAFNVLVMSEESRLGREAIETAYALKQLVQAGVRVFFYLEDRERTLDSPTDKIMLSLTTFADELEREKARQRTYDAMLRKAKAGHVTGGRLFGYDNIDVLGSDGKRSHVERRINEREAAVIRRIFELCEAGHGYTRIAKTLNAEGTASPRPQQGRPAGWSPSSIHEVLRRTAYRGEITWNATRKRDKWGRTNASARPEADWITIDAPHLRIVSEALWSAARTRLTGIRTRLLAASDGRHGRHARDVDSAHLLAGFARCAQCGASFYPLSRSHGRRRAFFYGCSAHHKRGATVCRNNLVMGKERIDAAVLTAIGGDVLRPAVVQAVVDGVFEALAPDATAPALEQARAALASVEAETARLVSALAIGGDLPPVVAALQERQRRQADLQRTIAELSAARPRLNRRAIEREVRERLTRWRALLTDHVADGRQLLRELLSGPIRFTPERKTGVYKFEGEIALGHLFTGITGVAPFVVSPSGIGERCNVKFSGKAA